MSSLLLLSPDQGEALNQLFLGVHLTFEKGEA